MRRYRRWIALVLGLVCLGYFGSQIWTHRAELMRLPWGSSMVLALAVAVIIQLGVSLFDAWCWGRLVRALGIPAESRRAVGVFSVSQFGKYLPGNVGQHVGRVALSREEGWQTGRIVLSLLIENGFTLASGLLIAVGGGMLLAVGGSWDSSRAALLVAVVALGWVVGATVLRRVLRDPPPFLRRWLGLSEPVNLDVRALLWYFGSHFVSYAGIGFVFAVLVRSIRGSWPIDAWALPFAITVSFLAGYLVPGAPAGLGAREAALTSILGPTLGVSVTISAALLWRVSMLLADLATFGLGLALRARSRSGAPTPG